MRILDSHLHLWDPDLLRYSWLSGDLDRRFGPVELAAVQPDTDDERAFILVQADAAPADTLAEVAWASEIAAEVGIRGIVGAAPLEDPDGSERILDVYATNPLVRGVRRLLQDEDDGFSAAPGFRASSVLVSERGLVFDACVRSRQLPAVAALADAVPGLDIVLDHFGKPPVGTADRPLGPADSPWLDEVRELAQRPRVRCKLSGLPDEAGGQWSAAQVLPFLDAALDAFGPDRLLYGSDWPVSARTADEARRWRDTVAHWAADRLGTEGADRVLWQVAAETYRIPGLGATPA